MKVYLLEKQVDGIFTTIGVFAKQSTAEQVKGMFIYEILEIQEMEVVE